MIVALRTRQQFDRIVREGSRIRRGELWCTWCPDFDRQNTSIGYSITRAVGPAVVRNRLRRRFRAILSAIDHEQPLPATLMVIGARPGASQLTFAQLNRLLVEITTTMRSQVAALNSAASSTAGTNSPPSDACKVS